MLFGCARVSTTDQDAAAQVQALEAAGCQMISGEKASGGRRDRPELHRLLDRLRPGDPLVVWKLDRLARARLEARDPALSRFRSYRIDAGIDMLRAWLVEITYGRSGTPGRCLRYVASDEAGARKLVQRSLRPRSSARKRIGVPDRFRELSDPWQWVPLRAANTLPAPVPLGKPTLPPGSPTRCPKADASALGRLC
jgi:hypothetical protein